MTHSGQRLWEKAKRLIPGGGQLLSKRVERFLPGLWPGYYAKAHGCLIQDLDGNEYLDFAQMGVGSCILGYADPDVNAAVIHAVREGSMSTLNSPEEVALAERLVALHPWAEMARFARTGGEACAIAVRIARAATGKGVAAFSGYHGWHDWYLAANLAHSANLDGQLLPGLEPAGLHRNLEGSAVPFEYGDLQSLERLFETHPGEIGVVIMEPCRSDHPDPEFLPGVRALCDTHEAVLIFDEVTSGLRMTLGGVHLLYDVAPDMAIFAKGLGNGFPIAAVIGRRSVMDAAQRTFISSTMWTERIGFTAALATLDKCEALDVPAHLVRTGELVQEAWRTAASACGLGVGVHGIPPLAGLAFQVEDPLAAQTLFAQEMLDRGFLAGAAVYTTLAYTDAIIARYAEACAEVFPIIQEAAASGTIRDKLRGEVIHAGFKRLT